MPDTLEREDLFDATFLDRLRVLALRLRKRRQLMRRGSQSTPATGFMREFKDYRHYTPREDYRAIAHVALRHRIILNFEGEAGQVKVDDIITKLLDQVKTPAQQAA